MIPRRLLIGLTFCPIFLFAVIVLAVDGVDNYCYVVGAFADTVSAALGRGTKAFEHRSAVNEDCLHEELACLCLAFILLFPVGDCRTEQLLNFAGSLFI